MQEQMVDVTRDVDILRKNQKGVLDQNHYEDVSSGLDRHNWGKNFRAQGYQQKHQKIKTKDNKDWISK